MAALYVLTKGLFTEEDLERPRPRLPRNLVAYTDDGRSALHQLAHDCYAAQQGVRVREELERMWALPQLVSVVYCTDDGHRAFHQLAQACFVSQGCRSCELVVVHTGRAPSEFFQERAKEDPRIVYRFFGDSGAAPAPARLPHAEGAWTEQVGWSQGLRWNVGCCIARGSVVVHFEDGCLYAANYVARMAMELKSAAPAAAMVGQWLTVSIADQSSRLVQGETPWAVAHTRAAWERQPFTDNWGPGGELLDGAHLAGFLSGLESSGAPVAVVQPGEDRTLVALCWFRGAVSASRARAVGLDEARAMERLMFSGEEVAERRPLVEAFSGELEEVARSLAALEEEVLGELLREVGAVYLCDFCRSPVAGLEDLRQSSKEVTAILPGRARRPLDTGVFASARGLWAPEKPTAGCEEPRGSSGLEHGWFADGYKKPQAACCRNCGSQLGWRFCADKPHLDAFWCVVWRHLRFHSGQLCEEVEPSVKHASEEGAVCPEGHRLWRFACGDFGGGAHQGFFVCDTCESQAEMNQQLWGCGRCDYDVCARCMRSFHDQIRLDRRGQGAI